MGFGVAGTALPLLLAVSLGLASSLRQAVPMAVVTTSGQIANYDELRWLVQFNKHFQR